MIPSNIKEWIFPEISDGTADAAVLSHDCGVDFKFRVESMGDAPFVVTNKHIKSWRTKLLTVAAQAGHNCFLYNTLEADPEGVYYHDDGNTFAILFAPGTFLEHNDVEGAPILLLISDRSCVLTGSKSSAGAKLIKKHRKKAIARALVTIDRNWQQWIAYTAPNYQSHAPDPAVGSVFEVNASRAGRLMRSVIPRNESCRVSLQKSQFHSKRPIFRMTSLSVVLSWFDRTLA